LSKLINSLLSVGPYLIELLLHRWILSCTARTAGIRSTTWQATTAT
jgi:hypothetical protein